MAIKTLVRNKFGKLALTFSSILLLSTLPYFAGSGLDTAEPVGAYLNGSFPSVLPEGRPYVPVFPNIQFSSPLTFNEVPNANKIIVGQRDGKIFWFDKEPNVSIKHTMLDLSNKVGVVWDGGFLGMALHPQFGISDKNYFYTWYTTKDRNNNDFPNNYTGQSCDSEEYWGNFLILARYEADPNTLNVQESSEQILLKIRMYGTTHRGGGLVFGDDGFLYLTTGDQTAFKKSQDIVNNLDGGILRLDVDKDNTKSHPPVRTMPEDHGFSDEITGNGYWIPNDNPFLSAEGENFEEYYSLGHRNPHRMTKDRATGKMYVGEIGGSRHEEINIVNKGKNFGWPLYEGFYQNTSCVPNLYNNMPHEQPLVAFPRSIANSIIGGYVYRGNEISELQGKYICADYGTGEEIFVVDINTGSYEQYGNFNSTNIISFGEDKQGELYILKQGVSTLYKLTAKNQGLGNTPELLSQTGAFDDLLTLSPSEGLIPYDLVESFWSDGALKKRWMAIPNDGNHDTAAEQISYDDIDDWNFPIGSVLVKHFELPIDERDPTKTKRLETRFSIKGSDGKFYFVTYKWNEEQNDAVLLRSGLDESISITKANGNQSEQTWSYPSAIECISCHNSTNGGTLGTKSRYLNKDYTYSKTGRTANQLVTLSHLGILNQNISDDDTNNILTSKSITDATASLDEKARSYLDLNCAYCHRSGTGNRGNFDLRLNLDILQTGILSATPYISLGIPNEKIVDAGNVSTSILYHRMNSTEAAIKMPPIGKNKIDAKAVQLINEWINQLAPEDCDDKIIMEVYNDVPGTSIANLKNEEKFPNQPTSTTQLTEFRIPINVADNYGVRVKGLLKAPETGTYYFWITGDDNVELSLSTDDNESNATRIAYHNSWTHDGEWNKYSTQKSSGISLVGGQNYYIEALMNEANGGDNLSVGWRKPSNGDGNSPIQVIPCSAFDSFDTNSIVNVTGVSVNPQEISLEISSSSQITAEVSPSDASDTSLSWQSSDENVVTVSSSGLVTAVAEGTATVTVTTTDGAYTAETTINVSQPIIEVTGVSLSPSTIGITVGETSTLTAEVSPSDASDTSLSWQSSDENVATVSSSGLVTGIAEGTATVTVTTTDGSYTAETTINISQPIIEVTGVSLSPSNIGITVGETSTLTAEVSPSDASDTSLSWQSSDENVATVSSNGLVTGIAEGTAIVTVTTTDGSYTAETTINISELVIEVTGVSLSPSNIGITVGETSTLTAEVSPSDASDTSLSWQSSDENVATVSSSGLVTGIAEGTAIVTVTTTDGAYTAETTINVSELVIEVTGVSLSPSTIGITVGETSTLTAEVSPSDASDTSLSWQSSDENVATVSSSGLVTGIAEGTAIVTVTTTDGAYTAETTINVSELVIEVTGVSLSPSTIGITVGETSTLTAEVSPSDASDTSLSWQSSDENVATVSSSGLVTGIAEGTAIVTVTTTDGAYTAETTINVSELVIEVTGVSLSPSTIGITVGETSTLTAEVSPSDASDTSLSWQSSDENVATVSSSGLVTGVAEGTATVTVTTTDGAYTAETTINVSELVIEVTGVSLSPSTIGITVGETSTLTAEVIPSNASDTSLSWQSSDENVATVSSSGLVTAVAEGTVTITVTTTDGAYTAETTINVSQPIIEVTGVSLSPSTIGITVGETSTLTAEVSPSDASDTSLSWQSSDENVATVSSSGLVTAVAEGTVTITVTTTDGAYTAETTINVSQPIIEVTGVSLSPSTIGITVGETSTLTAEVSPSDASDTSLSWQSSDENVATVSSSGLVTGIAEGTATVTVTTTDGAYTAETTINVSQPIIEVTGVSLSPSTIGITVGETSTLTAEVSPSDASDASLSWQSSDENVATVSSNGLVTGVAEGTATVTVTTTDGNFTDTANISVTRVTENCSASGVITMRRYDQILGISLDNLFADSNFPNNPSSTKELEEFEIPPYVADNYGAWVSGYLCAPETGTYYFWISGDDHVRLNLSSSANSSNKATIAFHNGHTNLRLWTRYESQKSEGIDLVAGESYYIEAFMKEGVGGDHLSVGWRKPSHGNGTEPFEIIPGNVLSPNKDIPYEVSVNAVAITPRQLSIYEGNTFELSAEISPANAANKRVTWSSSNTNIATVDRFGLVTAISKGNATITVQSNDGGFSAESRITVLSENEEVCTANGSITMRKYDNIAGITLSELFIAPNFPENPSSTVELDSFEIPTNVGNNYGAWVSGYLCAPETGTYYFWASGDNFVKFNLSSNEDMANSETIAFHNGHTNPKIWDKYPSQKSAGINLEQGKTYYIEGYMKEGVGGDHFAVGWRKPSDGDGLIPAEVIPGYVLSSNTAQQFPVQASLKKSIDIQIIKIYPNPASEIITIETYDSYKILSISILDSSGRTINEFNQNAFYSTNNKNELDISHLSKGVYSIIVITDDFQQHVEQLLVR